MFKSVEVNGVSVEVDGHFMLLAASEVRYAATRAWGWRHGFLEAALTAEVVAKNQPAQSTAQPASSSGSESIAPVAAGEAVT